MAENINDQYVDVDLTSDSNITKFSGDTFMQRMSMRVGYNDLKTLFDKGTVDRYFLKLILENNEMRVVPMGEIFFKMILLLRNSSALIKRGLVDGLESTFNSSKTISTKLMVKDILHYLCRVEFLSEDVPNSIPDKNVYEAVARCNHLFSSKSPVSLVHFMSRMLVSHVETVLLSQQLETVDFGELMLKPEIDYHRAGFAVDKRCGHVDGVPGLCEGDCQRVSYDHAIMSVAHKPLPGIQYGGPGLSDRIIEPKELFEARERVNVPIPVELHTVEQFAIRYVFDRRAVSHAELHQALAQRFVGSQPNFITTIISTLLHSGRIFKVGKNYCANNG